MGLAPQLFHYERMTEALRVLLRPETQLVAINKGRYLRNGAGELDIGAGAFVRLHHGQRGTLHRKTVPVELYVHHYPLLRRPGLEVPHASKTNCP